MLKILLLLPRLETRSFGSLGGGVGAVVCATTSAYGQSKPARARLMIHLGRWGGRGRRGAVGGGGGGGWWGVGGVGALVCATTFGYGQIKPARAILIINLERSPPPPVYMSGIICVKRFHKDSLKVKKQSHIVAKIKKKKNDRFYLGLDCYDLLRKSRNDGKTRLSKSGF